jgi:biopolymer transport protein ExbD
VALGKSKKRSRTFKPPALMLTSMMDMFTIILIFLLCSFSETPEKLKLDQNLQLPKSSSECEYAKSIKVILSKKELRLNDEVVATVNGGIIQGLSDAQDPKSSSFFQRLQTYYKSNKEEKSDAEQSTHLLLLCDKSHPFKTINTVIKTAGMAGYPNFQFAVLQE